LYSRYHLGWAGVTALTSARYQYIDAPREEVYDLLQDPRQRTNIAGDQTEIRRRMSDELKGLTKTADAAAAAQMPTAAAADPKDKPEAVEAYRRAMELVDQRRWLEAVTPIQNVLRDIPEAPEIWQQLGIVAGALNRYDTALDAYQHMAALKPS